MLHRSGRADPSNASAPDLPEEHQQRLDESHQASPGLPQGQGGTCPCFMPLLMIHIFQTLNHQSIIFFSNLVVTSLFPQICAESSEIPACQFVMCILTLQHERWKSFAQETALLCTGFQAQQHR